VVLAKLGSYFFLDQPEDLVCALVLWLFPDLFLGHSDDGFDSSGTNCHLPGGGCRALGLVESFDLQGIGQASHSI
jgi:hypothetical protein